MIVFGSRLRLCCLRLKRTRMKLDTSEAERQLYWSFSTAGVLPDSVLHYCALSCNFATGAWRRLLINKTCPKSIRTSNQVVGSSNLSGRAISPDDVDHPIPPETALVCGFLSAVVSSLLVSGGPDRASVGHNQVTERRARSGSREETNRGA